MKAMMSHEPGGLETLKLTEVDTPAPGPGEIRIAVKAAGVNFLDTLIIRDLYQFKPPRPFAPGGEVAGIVEAVGDGVAGFAPGDRVIAGGVNGGYATHFIANAAGAYKIPDAMPFDEAAAFLLTYGTSHYALKDRAKLAPGESLFILGAAGGVGAAAIELGKAFGAKVWMLHVAAPEPEFVGFGVGPQYIRDSMAEELKKEHKMLFEYANQFKSEGIDTDELLIKGATTDMIMEEAEKLNIDLIITGHHDHGLRLSLCPAGRSL